MIGTAAAAAVGVTAALWMRQRDQDRLDRQYQSLARLFFTMPPPGSEAAPGVRRPGLTLIRGGAS